MTVEAKIRRHVFALSGCTHCPKMHKPVVSGGPVVSRIILVGQAPGDKEPKLGRPFAWTAGKTLFRWFQEALGWTEEETRCRIYFAAVCRCFPGKNPKGGDRVPDPQEIENCTDWMNAEIRILKPELVIPVGKLAMRQFLEDAPLIDRIGKKFHGERSGVPFDIIPLPHPSGASPWHRMEPGKTLLWQALQKIARHPVIKDLSND